MSETETTTPATTRELLETAFLRAPFVRAPEGARTIFIVTLSAACAPLLAGLLLFGWRAAFVAAIAIFGCVLIERAYYRVTRIPSLHGRSHAYLTGVLLAITLPPFVPWYVPLLAAAFAIIVGKGIFGGVGHFLWQPALVGRLAVAVIFSAETMNPAAWPVLAQEKLLIGDIQSAEQVEHFQGWRHRPAPRNAQAFLMTPPTKILSGLYNEEEPAFSSLVYAPDIPAAKPAALMQIPSIEDLLYGGRPGGIGETCAIVILVAGLYLIYRNYVKWQLPLCFLLSAGVVAAAAPVYFAGPNDTVDTVWWPIFAEGLDVGFTYVNCQILSGELLLAAFFLATEMTSRPVTTGGQVIFGLAGGALAMIFRIYLDSAIPCYLAVLAMNTLAPTIDALWRPRVLGMKRFRFLRRRREAP
jgi:Na+-translocating ferredoxin:NAD+ oxidoreductase RnfD subunit